MHADHLADGWASARKPPSLPGPQSDGVCSRRARSKKEKLKTQQRQAGLAVHSGCQEMVRPATCGITNEGNVTKASANFKDPPRFLQSPEGYAWFPVKMNSEGNHKRETSHKWQNGFNVVPIRRQKQGGKTVSRHIPTHQLINAKVTRSVRVVP